MRPVSSLRAPTHPSEFPEPDLYVTEARAAELLSINPRTLIKKLLGVMPQWSGTASELLVALSSAADESTRRSRIWPRTASNMGSEVRRLAPAFRAQGIEVEMTRDTNSQRTRRISFRRIQSEGASMALPIPAVRPVRTNPSIAPTAAVIPRPATAVPPPDAPDAPDTPVVEAHTPSATPPRRRPWLNWLTRRL